MSEQTQSIRDQIKSLSQDEFLKAHKKDDMVEMAETVGVEDTSGTKAELYDAIMAQFDLPDPSLRGSSTTEEPVATVWRIAAEMKAKDPEVRRKDIQAACQAEGVAYYTARTQIQAWHKATNGGERALDSLSADELPKVLRPAEPETSEPENTEEADA